MDFIYWAYQALKKCSLKNEGTVMKKSSIIIGIIIVIIAAILLITPYVLGERLQKSYPALLNRIDQSPNVNAALISYQRGFFESQAKIKLTRKIHKTINTFIVNQTIFHGPVIFTKNAKNRWRLYIAKGVVKNDVYSDNTILLIKHGY